MVYLRLKKLIKLELTKKTTIEGKQENKPTEKQSEKQPSIGTPKIPIQDDESYDVDTPEDDDADSYVNPIHSEKNIEDDD
jgi:hypothetical protein